MIDISNDSKNNLYNEVVLTGRLSEFRHALNAEIETIRKSVLSSLLIRNGHRVSKEDGWFKYRFYVEYSGSIPPDTPCTLIFEKERYDVTVVSYEETFITILTKTDLGGTIPKAQLENGSIVLMKKLIERLEQKSKKENAAGLRMLGESPDKFIAESPERREEGLNDEQWRAVQSVLSRDITFIWGPPGTGKTRVIGTIINELYTEKRTVLLVSHTNTAVDGAMKHVCEKLKNAQIEGVSFPALRIGASIDPQFANEYEEVTFDSHLKILSAELIERRTSLEEKESDNKRNLRAQEYRREQYLWMESWAARRSSFVRDVQNISQLETEESNLRDAISVQQNRVEEAINTIDSCADYFSTLRIYQKAETNLNQKTAERDRLVGKCDYYRAEMENKQNSIINHQRYAKLNRQLSEILSVAAQQSRVDQAKKEVDSLSLELKMLGVKIQTHKTALEQSKTKTAFGRMFSGIDSPANIQTQIDQLEAVRQKDTEDLVIKQQLLQQYSTELFNTKKLVAEKRDIKLVSSPDRLRSEIELLKSNDVKTQTVLAQHQQQHNISLNAFHEAKDRLDAIRATMLINPETVKATLAKEEDTLSDLRQKYDDIGHSIAAIVANLNNQIEEFTNINPDTKHNISYSTAVEIWDSVYTDLQGVFAGISLSDIENEIERLNNGIQNIHAKILKINKQINELSTLIINHVPIIGTTLSKAYLEDAIQERTFDTVILDEASMASIPALWCSAYLAEKNIVIVGDFKQLAPIVISDEAIAKKWLGRDIFNHSGMDDDKKVRPDYFVALQQQFRMEKDIADIASDLYYEGRLKTSNATDWQKGKEEFKNWYGGAANSRSINILDTKELHAWVTGIPQGKGKTRLNHLSATLCIDLAFSLTKKLITKGLYEKTKLLIVSPYRAHTKRIQQLIEHECKIRGIKHDNFGLVKAGTIHSFQGSEADIVIFDLVVDEPHWSNNLFMALEDVNNDLRRMFNVATTRAKYKLFIVGNISWCRKRAKDNALGEFLKELIDRKKVPIHDAKRQFPHLAIAKPEPSISMEDLKGKRLTCTQENYYDILLTDILNASEKIVIFSPFMAKDRLSNVLPALQTAINRGITIYVITKPCSEFRKSEQSNKRACERILVSNGIGIIHKKKMHEKLVFIDSSILWTGSLNTLSFSNTQEIMERRQDETIFEDYAHQMNIECLVGIVHAKENQNCPVCKKEMLAAESDSGGIYWTCSECDYSRNSDEPPPIDGELCCPKCGEAISFKMINQPRWICKYGHYRKARRSDLMLPKMLAKVPENQIIKAITVLSGKRPKCDFERNILSATVIRAFDNKGRLVAGFKTIQEASDYSKTILNKSITTKSISRAINGHQSTAGTYQWRRYQSGTEAVDLKPSKLTK